MYYCGMKTIEQLKEKPPVYIGIWGGKIDVVANFENIYITEQEYKAEQSPYSNDQYWLENKAKLEKVLSNYNDVNILFAYYTYEDYSGTAFVLFERGGKLYEVNASHCSCYGLEGQFEPEETTVEAIIFRLENGGFYDTEMNQAVKTYFM